MLVGEIQIGMVAPKNIAWLVLRHGEAAAARIAAFPQAGVPRIKTSIRAGAAGMRARDWFEHAAAHDPFAANAAPLKPQAMQRIAP